MLDSSRSKFYEENFPPQFRVEKKGEKKNVETNGEIFGLRIEINKSTKCQLYNQKKTLQTEVNPNLKRMVFITFHYCTTKRRRVNQNYNKILECDWLSPAQFEH